MYFKLAHSVFQVDKAAVIRLIPVFPFSLREDMRIELMIEPFSGFRRYKRRALSGTALFSTRLPARVLDGAVCMELSFPQEDRYIVRVFIAGEPVEVHEVYALEEDLFALSPMRGDNHMHSAYSDGKDSPQYMAAAACRRGHDYAVMTDHNTYSSSVMCRDFFAPTGMEFVVIPGEEIHAPGNHVHIVNVGGGESVADWSRTSPDYAAAVEAELKKVDPAMEETDRRAAAASQVVFDKIRETGGVSILCHPLWIYNSVYQQSQDITDYLCDNKRFDAFELIAGGAYEEGTQLQLAYYRDLPEMPIVGDSDAHVTVGPILLPGKFTIAFVRSRDMEGIKEALRNGLAVGGEKNKLYGPYRLLKYAYFLLKNFYPAHDAESAEQGRLMQRYVARGGDERALADFSGAPRPAAMFDDIVFGR